MTKGLDVTTPPKTPATTPPPYTTPHTQTGSTETPALSFHPSSFAFQHEAKIYHWNEHNQSHSVPYIHRVEHRGHNHSLHYLSGFPTKQSLTTSGSQTLWPVCLVASTRCLVQHIPIRTHNNTPKIAVRWSHGTRRLHIRGSVTIWVVGWTCVGSSSSRCRPLLYLLHFRHLRHLCHLPFLCANVCLW